MGSKFSKKTNNRKFVITVSSLIIIFISIVISIILRWNNLKSLEVINLNNMEEVKWEEQFPKEAYSNINEATGVMEYGCPTSLIKISPVIKSDLTYWIVNVKIKSPKQLKSAFAGDKFSLSIKEKTSSIAKAKGAILAINGAACGFNEKGVVIRDGIVYRDTYLDCAPLVIDKNGDFAIYDYGVQSGEDLLKLGAFHTFDMGPDLIRNGEIVDYGDTWYKENREPRTGVGQRGKLDYVIIVSDGRSFKSKGMSCYDVAVELQNQGCYVGYNLDGGGSTTLFYNGEVINSPSDLSGERKISDILYFTN